MLVIDKRLTRDRAYANAAAKYLSGDTAAAVDILRRVFPADTSTAIRECLGPFRKNKIKRGG